MIRTWWQNLQNRCRTCSRVTLTAGVLLTGLVVSGLLMAAGAAGLAWTNTEAFCIGCHEMKNNVYAEYKGTIHDTNRSGVRAVCSDCHVPREPGPMLWRKVLASFELWGHFVTGVIDTKEKFQANKTRLAHNEWKRMLTTDSHECRNCHKRESMSAEKQSEKAQARHAKATQEGMTCIECHYGIAHSEPDGIGPQELKAELLKKK